MLYRVFPLRPGARPEPLLVPRDRQGAGRHDDPDRYTAVYLAREPIGAVAEAIQAFRGRELTERALVRPDGAVRTLATLDDDALDGLVDLDDPTVLAGRALRPSQVATGDRAVTQRIARAAFDDGATGLSWWSTLEAAWTNVTLFGERIGGRLRLVEAVPLSLDHPAIVDAADRLGVRIAPRPRRRPRLAIVRRADDARPDAPADPSALDGVADTDRDG